MEDNFSLLISDLTDFHNSVFRKEKTESHKKLGTSLSSMQEILDRTQTKIKKILHALKLKLKYN